MNVLGIDTSCDDTAVAVVADGRTVRSSIVMSQQPLHAEHGGVVPEVASRRHLEDIRPAVERALAAASLDLDAIDAVAATVGPGLAGSLMVGYNFGRALALGRRLPFVPVNHLEGHIYSAWVIASEPDEPDEPAPLLPLLVLIVSGGHTELVLMRDHGLYHRLGGTRDDAAGEAFDKVGRLLGLGYPGGPSVQRAAAMLPSDVDPVKLPRAWLRGSYDFSFSGLKTAVLHLVQNLGPATDATRISAIASGFQDSVADVLATKAAAAAREHNVQGMVLCGGVAANSAVRARLRDALPPALPLHVPPIWLCTDNGAMIASAGFYQLASAVPASSGGDVRPGLTLPLQQA